MFRFLLLLSLLVATTTFAARSHALSRLPHHHDLSQRITQRSILESPGNSTRVRRTRRSCKPRHNTSATSTHVSTTSSHTPSSTSTTTHSAPTTDNSSSDDNLPGVAFKPANWPSKTQVGASPTATQASPSDPYLELLSEAYNNKDNDLFTSVHNGEMTYYSQGLGSCGDTYDDNSFTAAVSHLMYDAWPGATEETNRNPICGPYVPGRKTISPTSGNFVTSISGSTFAVLGGDGFLNCASSAAMDSQCHIPLTATVTHGDKQIIVSIVDRCAACGPDDIDLTPTAFAALADMSLGRTSVSWKFNNY